MTQNRSGCIYIYATFHIASLEEFFKFLYHDGSIWNHLFHDGIFQSSQKIHDGTKKVMDRRFQMIQEKMIFHFKTSQFERNKLQKWPSVKGVNKRQWGKQVPARADRRQ